MSAAFELLEPLISIICRVASVAFGTTEHYRAPPGHAEVPQESLNLAWWRSSRLQELNVSQPMHRVRKALHHANQQRSLSIRLGSPLLPVLECPHVGPQVSREQTTRQV